uniref:Uncharacterized protein n=1 Tax=Anguilla anguilla TaxID=7936 RepID=A0A0E9VAJ9_ANGAN
MKKASKYHIWVGQLPTSDNFAPNKQVNKSTSYVQLC